MSPGQGRGGLGTAGAPAGDGHFASRSAHPCAQAGLIPAAPKAERGSEGAMGGREKMRGEQREAAEGREPRGEGSLCTSAGAQCELSEGEGTASRGSEETASITNGGPKRWTMGGRLKASLLRD